MKRLFALLVAVAALLTGALVSTAPASAYIYDPAISGWKFWSASPSLSPSGICVDGSAINGPYYQVAYKAQQWNVVIGNDVVALNYRTDCVAAGYPPSRRMVIGTYSNSTDGLCRLVTNTAAAEYNGFNRWTAGPGSYINTANANCIGTQARRDHQVAAAIGELLGLSVHNSSGWNSRVMNETTYSRENITSPTVVEGQKLREVYLGVFCDSGTNC